MLSDSHFLEGLGRLHLVLNQALPLGFHIVLDKISVSIFYKILICIEL